uniref:Phosphodiesterase n=1 Tax=Globisporangium ultimum (strain ATCC 200006 / CBS 805.95 / DAOM BR144) TaxID=431595 RepID=K3WU70_GLOUD
MPKVTTGLNRRSVQVVPKRSTTGKLIFVQQDSHPWFCYFIDRDVELKFQTYYRQEKQTHVAIYMSCLVGLATVFCVHGALEKITGTTVGFLLALGLLDAQYGTVVAENGSTSWFDADILVFITFLLYVTAVGCAFYLWRRRGETQFACIWFDPVQLVILSYCHLVLIPVALAMVMCIDKQMGFRDGMEVDSYAGKVLIELLGSMFVDGLYAFLTLMVSIVACLLRLQFPYFAVLCAEFAILMCVVLGVYYSQSPTRWSLTGVFLVLLGLLLRGVWENELSCRREFLSSVNLVSENRRLSNQNVEMKEELSGKLNYQLHYEMGDILRILCQIKTNMSANERRDIDKIITALVTNQDLFEVSLDPSMTEYEDEVQGWIHMMAFKEPPPGLARASSRLFSDRRPRRTSSQILQAANSRRMSHTAETDEGYSRDLISQFFVSDIDIDESEGLSRWLMNTIRDQFFVDMFHIEQQCASPLQVVFITCVELNNLGTRLNLDMKKVAAFIGAVENHYFKRNPYHNCLHAGAVVVDMNFYLRRLNLNVDDRTFFVGLIAAAAHDVSHPGVNNGFLVATKSKLAITYSDDSVLERMHIAELYRILSHGKFDIFSHMTLPVRIEIRKLLIQMILATDLSRHFTHVSKLKSKKFAISEETKGLEVTLIMETLLMLADLGHTVKPFAYHQVWANRISEEFFRQGEAEERHNLPISPLCDRRLANLPKSQVTFLTLLASPLFETAGQAFAIDEYDIVMKELHGNIRTWQTMIGACESTHETVSNHSNKASKEKENVVRSAGPVITETQVVEVIN